MPGRRSCICRRTDRQLVSASLSSHSRILEVTVRRPLLAITLAVGLALAFGGCFATVYDAEDAYYVDEAPPAPYVEVVPRAPGPGWVWVDGYWSWSRHRYVWVPGAWRRPPRANHVWVGGVWTRTNGRYHYVRGRWAPHSRADYYRARRPAPVHRAGPPPARRPAPADRRPPPRRH
ncbi:MAG: hypothetical protein EP329_25140 [Deltaproteobacteria bacterium]|nr:MAG: hypothetical protein EP329_25140 [Deltaproteobacteria bacterium]